MEQVRAVELAAGVVGVKVKSHHHGVGAGERMKAPVHLLHPLHHMSRVCSFYLHTS
jgi:hypothetical protein